MLITFESNYKEITLPAWVLIFFLDGEEDKKYYFFGGEFSAARDEAYASLKWKPENCWDFKIYFTDITYVMSE